MKVENFTQTDGFGRPMDQNSWVGFIIEQPTQSAAKGEEGLMSEASLTSSCLLKTPKAVHGWVFPVQDHSLEVDISFDNATEGMYTVFYQNCHLGSSTSFDLSMVCHNAGDSPLSAGENEMPMVYGVSAILFALAFATWVFVMARNREALHIIHWLMASLVCVKAVSCLLQGLRFQSLKEHGDGFGWTTASYVMSFIKGLMFFSVIGLVGSGWSLINPELLPRMKTFIVTILFLQVIVNLATVMVEEMSPGTQGWLTWRDLLHLADLLCCCAILFPVVWWIRILQSQVAEDGKNQITMMKLKVFREFYVLVVSYIYFTRVALFLLTSMLPCKDRWWTEVTSEAVTLLLFLVVGFKFQPHLDNVYLKLDADPEAQQGNEFELTEGERLPATRGGLAP